MNSVVLAMNLWGRPVAVALFAIFLETFRGRLAGPILAGLGELLHFASMTLLIVAAVLAGWGCWKLWCAATGRGELCEACGAPTRLIDPGRYSPHFRCMACGLNRRAYR